MQGFFSKSTLQGAAPEARRGLPKCGVCKFAPECNSPRMPPAGSGASGVLIVGEAPGKAEDSLGMPFRGERGQRLRESLREVGQRLGDSWQTYSMICHPSWQYTDKNINACRPALLRTIDELRPKVIVLLGSAPIRSLMPAERGGAVGGEDRWVGYSIPSLQHKAWLCPVYSLTRVVQNWDNPVTSVIWHQHLRNAFSKVADEPRAYSMRELWDKVEVILSPRLARKRLADLARAEGVLAFDYEANSLKPDRRGARLAAVSFCLNGQDTFSLPIDDDSMLPHISRVLRSERLAKVASNMKNEERWTKSKMGHWVANWHWDTMLAAHVIDQRKHTTSIKFQAFVHFGVPDYDRFVEPFFASGRDGFNKIFTMDKKDLLLYNGLDSLLEFMVMEKQREALGYART